MRIDYFLWLALLGLTCSLKANEPSNIAINVFQQFYQQQDIPLSKSDVKERLMENRFLVAQAHSHHPALLKRQSKVGFSNHYYQSQMMARLFFILEPRIKAIPAPSQGIKTLSKKELIQLIGELPNDNMYSSQQWAFWYTYLLDAKRNISFADIMLEQSIQGRFKLHQGNVSFLQNRLQQKAHYFDIYQLAKTEIPNGKVLINELETLTLGEVIRPAMKSYFGVEQLLHADPSPFINALKATITNTEILAFYKQNKTSFKYLDSLHATGALFDDKTIAMHVLNLAKEEDLQSALSANQINNAFTVQPITRNASPKWLTQLAFNSKPGTLSALVRTPQSKWALVQTHSPSYSFYPANSETVRYQAIKALTTKKAKQRYQQLYRKWVEQELTKSKRDRT